MLEIGIVANPHSKLNKRNPSLIGKLANVLGQRGILEKSQSVNDLHSIARKFLDLRLPIVAINGGDGSISTVLTTFISVYEKAQVPLPQFALLTGGTMNVIASNLGISGEPDHLLRKLLLQLEKSPGNLQHQMISSLCIRDGGRRFGFLFGTGLAPRFLEMFYAVKSDAFGAAVAVLKLYLSYFFRPSFFRQVVQTEAVELHLEHSSGLLALCGRAESCDIIC